MRYAALTLLFLVVGCRCSNGAGTDGDASEDGSDGDSADVRDDEGRLDSVEELFHDPDAQIEETVDMNDAGEDTLIDQFPSDCFSPLDGPDDLIPADWVAVLPDRAPTPCDGCCRQVTISPYDNISPYDMLGDYIAYLIARSEGGTLTQLRIKRIDGVEEFIVREEIRSPPSCRQLGPPAMYGNQVVYVNSYKSSETLLRCELILLTLPSGESEVIHAFDVPWGDGWCPSSGESIDFNGAQVVYGANKVGGAGMEQIFLYNLPFGAFSHYAGIVMLRRA